MPERGDGRWSGGACGGFVAEVGNRRVFFGLKLENGFGRHFVVEGFGATEFMDGGAAVERGSWGLASRGRDLTGRRSDGKMGSVGACGGLVCGRGNRPVFFGLKLENGFER